MRSRLKFPYFITLLLFFLVLIIGPLLLMVEWLARQRKSTLVTVKTNLSKPLCQKLNL